eukprot:GHVN01057543.1.p1 GENE.GHVN01057543.1~~GHVN01057543.1.p1  ORF type:complete len:336 (+),score=38.13 GHVN01057543.1:314-1321(+)
MSLTGTPTQTPTDTITGVPAPRPPAPFFRPATGSPALPKRPSRPPLHPKQAVVPPPSKIVAFRPPRAGEGEARPPPRRDPPVLAKQLPSRPRPCPPPLGSLAKRPVGKRPPPPPSGKCPHGATGAGNVTSGDGPVPGGRKLRWVALSEMKVKGTIFESILSDARCRQDVVAIVDNRHFDEVFLRPPATTTKASESPGGKGDAQDNLLDVNRESSQERVLSKVRSIPVPIPVEPKKGSQKLLSDRRAQNLAIVLARIPISTEVCSFLLTRRCDSKGKLRLIFPVQTLVSQLTLTTLIRLTAFFLTINRHVPFEPHSPTDTCLTAHCIENRQCCYRS